MATEARFFPTAATPWVRGEGVPWGLGLEVTLLHWREMTGACVLEIAYGWSNTVNILLMITTFNLECLIWIRSK